MEKILLILAFVLFVVYLILKLIFNRIDKNKESVEKKAIYQYQVSELVRSVEKRINAILTEHNINILTNEFSNSDFHRAIQRNMIYARKSITQNGMPNFDETVFVNFAADMVIVFATEDVTNQRKNLLIDTFDIVPPFSRIFDTFLDCVKQIQEYGLLNNDFPQLKLAINNVMNKVDVQLKFMHGESIF